MYRTTENTIKFMRENNVLIVPPVRNCSMRFWSAIRWKISPELRIWKKLRGKRISFTQNSERIFKLICVLTYKRSLFRTISTSSLPIIKIAWPIIIRLIKEIFFWRMPVSTILCVINGKSSWIELLINSPIIIWPKYFYKSKCARTIFFRPTRSWSAE